MTEKSPFVTKTRKIASSSLMNMLHPNDETLFHPSKNMNFNFFHSETRLTGSNEALFHPSKNMNFNFL